jgi:hypothetical protein
VPIIGDFIVIALAFASAAGAAGLAGAASTAAGAGATGAAAGAIATGIGMGAAAGAITYVCCPEKSCFMVILKSPSSILSSLMPDLLMVFISSCICFYSMSIVLVSKVN